MPIALVSSMVCGAQQPELKPHKLKSGRIVYPKQAGPMIAPNMPDKKIFVLSYQTDLSTKNVKPLEQEAMEVWEDFRPKFETMPDLTTVILQADEKPTGTLVQSNRTYRFAIDRKSDGSWQWVKDNHKVSK
jgi:hypothetical protein